MSFTVTVYTPGTKVMHVKIAGTRAAVHKTVRALLEANSHAVVEVRELVRRTDLDPTQDDRARARAKGEAKHAKFLAARAENERKAAVLRLAEVEAEGARLRALLSE